MVTSSGLVRWTEVEQLLTGKPYSKQAMEEALEPIDVPKYFGGITKEELIQLIY